MALEGLHHRGRRRDRIPSDDRGAGVERPQRQRVVAVDHDRVADQIARRDAHAQRAVEVRSGVVVAELQGVHVGRDQLFLALELAADHFPEHVEPHVQQRGQGADVDDVLEQLALAGVMVFLDAHVHQRHADHVHVLAHGLARQRLAGVVNAVAARQDLGDVPDLAVRVHAHHQVHAAAAAEMAAFADPHLIPSGQPLDVGREDVLRRHRHAHAEHRLGEHAVGARRAAAVDVGEFDDAVVDRPDVLHKRTIAPQSRAQAAIPSSRDGDRRRAGRRGWLMSGPKRCS